MSKGIMEKGGPAFPGRLDTLIEGELKFWPGMSLRAYFAAQALQGLCASPANQDVEYEQIAGEAWAMADAMLDSGLMDGEVPADD